MTCGSELFQKYVLAHAETDALSLQVWRGTPWMASLFTDDRRRSIMDWMVARFGEPARPFGDDPTPGRWREGNATVFGWTWFGFSTEAEMIEAVEAWGQDPTKPTDTQTAGGEET